MLLCAGPDEEVAAELARRAVTMFPPQQAIVLSSWRSGELRGAIDAVLDSLYSVHSDIEDAAHEAAVRAVDAARVILEEAGWQVEPRTIGDHRHSWSVSLDVAEDADASVIVAGSSERPHPRPGAIGSQVRALAHRSRRPLLVVPAGDGSSPEGPAVVAYDGSAPARRATLEAARLLSARSALVGTVWRSIRSAVPTALAAVPSGIAERGAEQLDSEAGAAASDMADEGVRLLAGSGWDAEGAALETDGAIWCALVDAAAERDATVIVTGTHGRSRMYGALLGSVAEGVMRHAGRPVLLVPQGA